MQERTSTAQAKGKAPASPEKLASALLVDRPQPGVVVLTLNRPESRNALSLGTIAELHVAIEGLATDRHVAAIVLAAAGPVFSAGHDLKELTAHRADADRGVAFFDETMTRCSAMMQAIVACPKPVIAAVQGIATAAGCQLVATCDLAVAAQSAKFATPGVNIGLFCSTPMVALSRNVSRKHAMEMLLLGEMVPAEQAAAYGLVNRVVPDADVLQEAHRTRRQDRRQVAAHRGYRQGCLLQAGRDAALRGLQVRHPRHGREHDGARCGGGDWRLPR